MTQPRSRCNDASSQPPRSPLCRPAPQIGQVNVGSQHRVALQTMTTTDTRNVAATVEQVGRCS